ncbi:MAG: hypothetical protein N3A69_04450 [Leptospiraceae bacterium]|nr:hypothetical protein [Leptospiraceae bacterium]
MQLEEFRREILARLSSLKYVEEIQISEIQEGGFSGEARVKVEYILNIRFKMFREVLTLSIALIHKNQRIWGLDKDNRIGWHIHPLENPKIHERITEKSIQEILEILESVCSKL